MEIYNGAVEAVATLSGALTVFAVGQITFVDWKRFGDVAILIVTLVGGFLLSAMAYTDTIWMAYGGYILFRMSYNMMMTVASYEIARNLRENSYGLVFGFNQFMALGVQTALTITVADSAGLNLCPRSQFYVYSGYYVVAGLGFGTYYLINQLRSRN